MSNYKKQAERAYEQWKNSDMDELWKAYESASVQKWQAWDDCKDLMASKYGRGLRVITKNTYIFTAGFVYEDDDNNTWFMHITPSHNYAIPVT